MKWLCKAVWLPEHYHGAREDCTTVTEHYTKESAKYIAFLLEKEFSKGLSYVYVEEKQ